MESKKKYPQKFLYVLKDYQKCSWITFFSMSGRNIPGLIYRSMFSVIQRWTFRRIFIKILEHLIGKYLSTSLDKFQKPSIKFATNHWKTTNQCKLLEYSEPNYERFPKTRCLLPGILREFLPQSRKLFWIRKQFKQGSNIWDC